MSLLRVFSPVFIHSVAHAGGKDIITEQRTDNALPGQKLRGCCMLKGAGVLHVGSIDLHVLVEQGLQAVRRLSYEIVILGNAQAAKAKKALGVVNNPGKLRVVRAYNMKNAPLGDMAANGHEGPDEMIHWDQVDTAVV